MIRLSPPSSNPQALAMCNIPSGSGFGGWKSRVIIGEKLAFGRKVVRRCMTGPLEYTSSSAFTSKSLILNTSVLYRCAIPNTSGSEPLYSPISILHWSQKCTRQASTSTHSKFLVHSPILTSLFSRYEINSSNPGCGSCFTMAAVSIFRIAAWALACSGGGREWMCVRMSVVLGMARTSLWVGSQGWVM